MNARSGLVLPIFLVILFFSIPCLPQSKSRECACNLTGLWLDLIVVIDHSLSMTSAGVAQVGSDVASLVYQMSISQQLGQFSRISLISFASNATIIGDLQAYNSVDDFIKNGLYTIKVDREDDFVNLQKALQAASQVLTDSHTSDRSNVRTAILLYSSAFRSGGLYDPHPIADQLRESTTIITVAVRLADEGDGVYRLGELASPGYNFSSNSTNLIGDLSTALCQVNCKCPKNWEQLADSFSSPLKLCGECVRYTDIVASWAIAKLACHNIEPGAYLASELDSAKHRFNYEYALSSITNPVGKLQFHIGLSVWANGTYGWEQPSGQQPIPLDSSYTVWTAGYPDSRHGDCISVLQQSNTSFRWINEPCDSSQGARYICQVDSCDTSKYCP